MITGNFLQHAQNLEVHASNTPAAQTHPLATQGNPRTCRNVLIPPTRRALRRAHSAYRCRQDESADTEKRLRTATEIRDSIEIVHTSEYANFLKAFFPVFNKILHQLPGHGGCTAIRISSFIVALPRGKRYKHRITLGAGWWQSVQGFHLLCHETD